MEVYIFTILFLGVLAYLEVAYKPDKNLKNILHFIVFFILVVEMGLRWEMATDWNSYLQAFQKINDWSTCSPEITNMEWGYGVLMFISKKITENYSFFLLLHALIYYTLTLLAFRSLTRYPILAMMLHYAFTMGVMGSNRQLLAVALVLFSIKFIVDRKFFRFLCCISIGFLFHSTILIALPLYFLNKRIDEKIVVLMVACAFAFGKSSIPSHIFSFFGGGISADKVDSYMDAFTGKQEYNLGFAGLIKRLAFVSIFIYNAKALSTRAKAYHILLNGYLLSLIIYFMFSSTLLILVNRGSLYFNVMEPVLLSYQGYLIYRKENKFFMTGIAVTLAFLYFFQSIGQYPELFIPYKGLFINQDYQRGLL